MQSNPSSNRLLEALPASCRERLIAASTQVDLPLGTEFYLRDERPRFLYLLTSGIASLVFVSEAGNSVELATQGAEGLVGWPYLLGPQTSQGDCTMQVAGAGFRVPLAAVQREFDQVPEARARILEYVQHQAIFANQIIACNRLHRAEARFARWLLIMADRLHGNEISMTQEFMSGLLGTRRTTVAEVCADLARHGALESRRGGVRILDRPALEKHACECYRILHARFKALYTGSAAAAPGPGPRNAHAAPATR